MKHGEIVVRIRERSAKFKTDVLAHGGGAFSRKAMDYADRILELVSDLEPAKILETSDALAALSAEIEKRYEDRRLLNRIKAFFRRGPK